MNLTQKTLVYLQRVLRKAIKSAYVSFSELCIIVRPSFLIKVLAFFKLHSLTQYKILCDITAVDFPERESRFEIVYNLLSVQFNTRIRIKTNVDELTPMDSAIRIYSAANWLEREVWDMYGVFFLKNNDIRRILTDYGFEGHPLRKDFPVTGFVEVRYDYLQKQVVYEPVELSQAYRLFNVESQWANVYTKYNIKL